MTAFAGLPWGRLAVSAFIWTCCLNLTSIAGGCETILVVEDEPALRRLAGGILNRAGYRVIQAGSGVEALQLWQQHDGAIDLIMTDMVLPDGLSGLDLVEKLHAFAPNLKVIYSSGYHQEVLAKKIELVEGYNYLSKPFALSFLQRTVRTRLDGRENIAEGQSGQIRVASKPCSL
jgi:DNA-binding NtrC family response regulator